MQEMTEFDADEKFDIRKLPRLEIIKPIDSMLRWFVFLIFGFVPVAFVARALTEGKMQTLQALIGLLVYFALFGAIYYGIKRYYVLDRTRNALFRTTRIFGSLHEKYVCALGDITCVAIDSRERTTKNGGSTGQFWYETCLILKNQRVIRLHRTFEDSYDEIQDAEQYAEYLGISCFNPKPGLEMKVVKMSDGKTGVEFCR